MPCSLLSGIVRHPPCSIPLPSTISSPSPSATHPEPRRRTPGTASVSHLFGPRLRSVPARPAALLVCQRQHSQDPLSSTRSWSRVRGAAVLLSLSRIRGVEGSSLCQSKVDKWSDSAIAGQSPQLRRPCLGHTYIRSRLSCPGLAKRKGVSQNSVARLICLDIER